MLTTGEVAKQLNVTDRTVRNWIETGLLPGYRLGQTYRVKETDLEEFLNKSKVNNESENGGN